MNSRRPSSQPVGKVRPRKSGDFCFRRAARGLVTLPAIILAACAGAALARAGENPIPAAVPADRYAAMSKHSPFALATAAPAPVVAGPSFAANWYVAGIARDGDTDFVTIKSRDATVQFFLRGKEEHREQGVVLEKINWSDDPLKSTVSIRKGNELAVIQFNEAIIHGPSGPAGQPAAAGGAVAAASPAGGTAQGIAKPPPNGFSPPPHQIPGLAPKPPQPPLQNRVPAPVSVAAPQVPGVQAPDSAAASGVRRRIRPVTPEN